MLFRSVSQSRYLEEKEVLEDASAFVNEFEENSEYKVTSTRKKFVEQHHAWKAEAYKGMPANSNSNQTDENGNLIRPKYLSNQKTVCLSCNIM